MRDSKQVLGVLALLFALPAWASDMCELGMMFFLPPGFLLFIVTWLVGLTVRGPMAAIIWGVLLLACAVPAVGVTLFYLGGSFHGPELRHEEMFGASVITLLALCAMYGWTFPRLVRVLRQPRRTQPA